jgi:5-methylcytosine-specific restriction endonuclease McrA
MDLRRSLLMEKEVVELAIAYVFHEHAATELAEQHGVSSQTVRRRLRDFGVQIRSSAEQRNCDQRRGRYNHSAAVQAAWARGEYNTERYRSTRATGDWGLDRAGCGNSFYGRRHTAESIQKMSAAAKERVLPGIGSYGDDWTSALRWQIATRDGHRCQVCGASDLMLQIHHVDHDRTNNFKANLLTVCAACHLAYHGRGELRQEMRAACARLVVPFQADHEALS